MLYSSRFLTVCLFFSLTLKSQHPYVNLLPSADGSLKITGFLLAGEWKQGFLNRDGLLENYNRKDTWLSFDESGYYKFEILNSGDSSANMKGIWRHDQKTSILTLEPGLSGEKKSEYIISASDSLKFLLQEINYLDKSIVGYEIGYHKLKKQAAKNIPVSKTFDNPDITIQLIIGEWSPCLRDSTMQDYRLVFHEDFTCFYSEVDMWCGTINPQKWEYDDKTSVLSMIPYDGGAFFYKIEKLDQETLQLNSYDPKTGEIKHTSNYRKRLISPATNTEKEE